MMLRIQVMLVGLKPYIMYVNKPDKPVVRDENKKYSAMAVTRRSRPRIPRAVPRVL